MACDIYAPEGAIPNNLTVTKLYDRYWAKRIEHDRHGRRGTAAARAQAAVAEDVAAEMWRCSATRLAISVAGQQVGDRAALQRLISDGVLTQIGGRYEFFHQTYSEYAVARWLSRSGSATDLDRLRDALDNGSVAGLWPVARHLLQLEMSADRYTTLAQAVPLTTAEGVRVQFLAAFNRHRPDLVTTVASRVDPQLLTSSVTVLSAAGDECVSVAAAVVITCLKLADSAGIARTAATAAQLYRRLPAAARPKFLNDVVVAMLSRDRGHDLGAETSVLRQFLSDTVAIEADDPIIEVLIDLYGQLPGPARAEVLGVVADRGHDSALETALLSAATQHACPSGAADMVAVLLTRNWPDPSFPPLPGLDHVGGNVAHRTAPAVVRLPNPSP